MTHNRRAFLTAAAGAVIMTCGAAHAQQGKPHVRILATGGTIAGTAASSTNTNTYRSATLGVQALIDAVPQLSDVATVSGEQFASLSSNDVTGALLLKLARKIEEQLAHPDISGVVVTHGTDVLEESAFFLDLTVRSSKPVVLVGAMRPATALSADGAMNLMQAVTLAASPDARGRGVLVVMNDRVGSAFYTTKTNSTTPDTFRAIEQGFLGVFAGINPRFYYPPAIPTNKPSFDPGSIEAFPKVPIIYMYEDQDTQQIEEAIRGGAKGIVIAGTGDGAAPGVVKARALQLTKQGFPIVFSSRIGSGVVTPKPHGIGAGVYNPQKARILLMLALAQGADIETIRRYFLG